MATGNEHIIRSEVHSVERDTSMWARKESKKKWRRAGTLGPRGSRRAKDGVRARPPGFLLNHEHLTNSRPASTSTPSLQ